MKVKKENLVIKTVIKKYSLEEILKKTNNSNIHTETNTGIDLGNEIKE